MALGTTEKIEKKYIMDEKIKELVRDTGGLGRIISEMLQEMDTSSRFSKSKKLPIQKD